MAKKIFSILLLCCLLLNVIGYHVIFYIRQAEIKAEIRKSLFHNANSKDQEIFVFLLNDKVTAKEVEWEGDDEFKFNGEMYDVIEKKTKENKLVVRCISDKKETALLNDYKKINNEDNSKSKSALLLKLSGNIYFLEAHPIFQFLQIVSSHNMLFKSEIISSCYHDVLTPPPQAC